MNKIASLITVDTVLLDLDLSSYKRVFEEASLLIEQHAGVSHQAIFDALIKRERIGSTCIGGSVAVPHCRIEGVSQVEIAILRTAKSVPTGTIDNRKARLFFVMAIPADDSGDFLDVLAEIGQMLKDNGLKEKLLEAATPVEVCELIGQWEAKEREPEALEPPTDDDEEEIHHPSETVDPMVAYIVT